MLAKRFVRIIFVTINRIESVWIGLDETELLVKYSNFVWNDENLRYSMKYVFGQSTLFIWATIVLIEKYRVLIKIFSDVFSTNSSHDIAMIQLIVHAHVRTIHSCK